MMDEIIYLEPDEEITSVIDKMKRTTGRFLGFVVPRDATLLQSVVNLRLLKKEASALDKQISIVTTDKIGRNLASQVGLNVYNSIKEEKPTFSPPPPSPESSEIIEIDMSKRTEVKPPSGVNVHHFQEASKPILWKKNRPPVFNPAPPQEKKESTSITSHALIKEARHWDPNMKKILWPIIVIVFILLSAAAYLLLPRANVKVFVLSENLEKSIPVVVSGKIAKSILDEKVFPGKMVEITKDLTQKFPTTGKKNLGGKATGTVTFTNGLDSANHKFSAGTKLIASSKTFILKSNVVVPGATVQNLKVVPGTITGQIEAENAGEDYNIKATRFTIVGLQASVQDALYAQSSADFTGGFTKEVQVVSQSDYDNAKQQLLDKNNQSITTELTKQTKGMKVLDKAVVSPDPEISAVPKVDEEATEFELKVTQKKQAVAFDFVKFKEFLTEILEKEVPSDKMVAIAADSDIVPVVNLTTYDKEELSLAVNVNAKIASRISADKIKPQIIGKGASQVTDYINGQDGVKSSEIKFTPSFWWRMPDLARNVTVSIEYINK